MRPGVGEPQDAPGGSDLFASRYWRASKPRLSSAVCIRPRHEGELCSGRDPSSWPLPWFRILSLPACHALASLQQRRKGLLVSRARARVRGIQGRNLNARGVGRPVVIVAGVGTVAAAVVGWPRAGAALGQLQLSDLLSGVRSRSGGAKSLPFVGATMLSLRLCPPAPRAMATLAPYGHS